MAQQQSVNRNMALGTEGERATQNPIATVSAIAGADIRVGYAVWKNTDLQFVNTGTGAPIGILWATKGAAYFTFKDEGSMLIPKGQNGTAVIEGDLFVKVSNTATVGQKVFANNATGQLTAGTAGGNVQGATETPFYIVDYGGASGTLLTVSTWRVK